VIGKYTVKAWPPIQQARKADSEAYKRTNANLFNLACGREVINIDDGPRAGRYISTSVSCQVKETSVKYSELSLPIGIVPGNSDVRVVKPPRPPSPDSVVSFTSRKKQILAKPILLLNPKVEIPENEVIYLEADDEYGSVIDPLNLYERPVEEEETPTTLTTNSEVGIVAPTSPEGDIESECGLYSEGEGETRPREADSTSVSCQSPVSVDIPESGPPLPIGLPAAISPLVPDSETERLETLRILNDCKPQSNKNI
jgi:hypothetical protein